MTEAAAHRQVANTIDVKHQHVKQVAEAMVALAAKQLKTVGRFKIPGAVLIMVNKKKPCVFKVKPMEQFEDMMKPMKEPARHTKRGVNGRFTKEPCVFTVGPMNKFKDMVK